MRHLEWPVLYMIFNIPSEFTVIKRLMIMDSVGIMLNATMVDIMIAFPRKLSIPSCISDHCIDCGCQQDKDDRYYNGILEELEEIRFHNNIDIVIQ